MDSFAVSQREACVKGVLLMLVMLTAAELLAARLRRSKRFIAWLCCKDLCAAPAERTGWCHWSCFQVSTLPVLGLSYVLVIAHIVLKRDRYQRKVQAGST